MSAKTKRSLPSKTGGLRRQHQGFGLLVVATLVGILLSTKVTAAEYTIQVGAFKNPSQAFADEIRRFGEVNTAQNSQGLTVFTVGRYRDLADAKGDLNRVQADYPSAYVRNMPSSARSTQPANAEGPAVAGGSQAKATVAATDAPPEAALWETLTDAERRRVVYLDGILHLKQGDDFVPLSEYRRTQSQ